MRPPFLFRDIKKLFVAPCKSVASSQGSQLLQCQGVLFVTVILQSFPVKKILSFSLLILCSLGILFCSNGQTSTATAAGKKIIIIRHGEKPTDGDNLSCKGLNRALALPQVLNSKFGLPSAVFVPAINGGKKTSTARMYQTVVPFVVKYNLRVNSKFDVDDAEGLAGALKQAEGTCLVVWEHKNINDITKALGVQQKLKWDADDFDSIWIVTLGTTGATVSTDKENLSPKDACP